MSRFFTFLITVLSLFTLSQMAQAATFYANRLDDPNPPHLSNCMADKSIDGQCSLREAVMAANDNNQGTNTILLKSGTYKLTIQGPDAAPFQDDDKGDLDILKNLNLVGKETNDPSKRTIIEAVSVNDRTFEIHKNSDVVFRGLTIQNGKTTVGHGGAVAVYDQNASLKLIRCTLSDNQAVNGGAIYFTGKILTIEQSLIYRNWAIHHPNLIGEMDGGGIYFDGPTMGITNSTISWNVAGRHGGGVYIGDSFFNPGHALFNNAAVVYNRSDQNKQDTFDGLGGGLYKTGNMTAVFANSMVAQNQSLVTNPWVQAHDCLSGPLPIESMGYNILGIGDLCQFSKKTTDKVGTKINPFDPGIASLPAENGGATMTHALLPNSPAIDAGNPGPSSYSAPSCNPEDQRGVPRIQGAQCDIGPLEKGEAEIEVLDTNIQLPDIEVGQVGKLSYIVVKNIGGDDLKVGQVQFVGPHASQFIATDECSMKILKITETCSLKVRSAPTQEGDFTAQFIIPSNAPLNPVNVSVGGKGVMTVQADPAPSSQNSGGNTSGGSQGVKEPENSVSSDGCSLNAVSGSSNISVSTYLMGLSLLALGLVRRRKK